MKLRYGKQEQVKFRNLHEYYYALGFLANTDNAKLIWEHNEDQGAWGKEGRILCFIPESNFPQNFRFTAGRGNVTARINCNDYVETLVSNHCFKNYAIGQVAEKILDTVPEQYKEDFIAGYGKALTGAACKPTDQGEKSTIKEKAVVMPQHKSGEQPKDDYIAPHIEIGTKVYSKAFGYGTVTNIYKGIFSVNFSIGKKQFQYPEAFKRGFLKLETE